MTTSVQTCYKHSDRRAGVRCQRCERPICPSCMNQASVGFHCPECVRGAQANVVTVSSLTTRPVVTTALVAVNLAIFAAQMLAPGDGTGGLLDPSSWEHRGALYGPAVAAGDWWRVFTAGFLHVNLIHVGFNMFLLWQLGQLLEGAVKRAGFAVLYLLSLLGGSFLVLVMSPNQVTVGASGAVFGLMGAAFVALRARGVDPFQTGIGPLIVINLVFTFAFPGISVGGHLGGLLAGALGGWIMWSWGPQQSTLGQTASTVLPTVVCAGLAVALFFGAMVIA